MLPPSHTHAHMAPFRTQRSTGQAGTHVNLTHACDPSLAHAAVLYVVDVVIKKGLLAQGIKFPGPLVGGSGLGQGQTAGMWGSGRDMGTGRSSGRGRGGQPLLGEQPRQGSGQDHHRWQEQFAEVAAAMAAPVAASVEA